MSSSLSGSDNMDPKTTFSEVEEVKTMTNESDLARVETMGTVKLTEGEIVFIPAPTADPQGELLSDSPHGVQLINLRSPEHEAMAENPD